MAKPSNFISSKWTPILAYVVGLLVTDGCLSSDKRHLEFNSKDKEQVENLIKCLSLTNKIGKKTREKGKIKKYYRVQFGSVQFYRFLESVGLSPRKSKILKKIKIPKKFFSDFIRGVFDGDGCFRVSVHPESQYPQIRTSFASASPNFIRWLQQEIKKELKINGFIEKARRDENLVYAKNDSLKLLNYIYYSPNIVYLSRKFKKARPYFMRM